MGAASGFHFTPAQNAWKPHMAQFCWVFCSSPPVPAVLTTYRGGGASESLVREASDNPGHGLDSGTYCGTKASVPAGRVQRAQDGTGQAFREKLQCGHERHRAAAAAGLYHAGK